jgi:hypothetical protein
MDFYKLSTTRTLSTNSITINNDILKIEIADDTINNIGRTNCSGTFNLAELVEKFSQDHGCIAIFPKAMHMTDHTDMIAMETTQLSLIEKGGGDPGVVNQKTDETPAAEGKVYPGSPWSVINSRYASYAYLYVLTPYKGCQTSELTLVYRDGAVIKHNNTTPTAEHILSMKTFLENWLPIAINGDDTISANETKTYTVTAPEGTTVYLSSDIGVINRSRITNGGSFNLNTDGLVAGETITIKAGYKYWSGVTTKEINIV